MKFSCCNGIRRQTGKRPGTKSRLIDKLFTNDLPILLLTFIKKFRVDTRSVMRGKMFSRLRQIEITGKVNSVQQTPIFVCSLF